MLRRPFTTQLLLLLVLVLLCGYAQAQSGSIFGDATFGMQAYRSESNGQAQKARSLYQQYTLGYKNNGILHDARFGAYAFLLGYEFNTIDPEFTINGSTLDNVSRISTGKLYYNGDLIIAPGGLPFRGHFYAKDLDRSQFISTPLPGYTVGAQPDSGRASDGHLISSDIYSELQNGSHRQLGGTLLIGIRNGSYLGAYRDVLSQLPRILIDYKQIDQKDLHGSGQGTHIRARDLAFISLNKKDNWVHVRRRDFTDYLDHANDSLSQQIMIGTIDQTLTRQWINLTNWIKISGEISYTEIREANQPELEKIYNVNLFSIGRHSNVATSILSQFSRVSEGGSITQVETLPASVRVDLGRDTSLLSRVIYDVEAVSALDGRSLTNDEVAAVETGHKSIYLDNMLELQRTRRVIIKPRVEFEARSVDEGKDGLALRFNTEILSNRALNKTFNWLGGYTFTTSKTNDEVSNRAGSYFQNEIYGSIERYFSSNLLAGGRTFLTTSTGDRRQAVAFRIPTASATSSIDTVSVDSDDSSGAINSGNFSLFIDHRHQRMTNRLDLTFEFFSADGQTKKQGSMEHSLDYRETIHSFAWNSSVVVGDNAENSRTVEQNYLLAENNDKSNSVNWSSHVTYHYDPNRSAGFTLLSAISGLNAGSMIINYNLNEELVYRIFTSNGIIRRIAEFSEKIGYESSGSATDARSETLYGYFDAAYYPTHNLYGKVRWEIVSYLQRSASQVVSTAEIGLDFKKLTVLASYKKGDKDRESDSLPGVSEQRWDFKVKKIF